MTSTKIQRISIREKTHQLTRILHELHGVLQTQRSVLRQRGMSLPSGVLRLLEDTQIALRELVNQLKDEEDGLHQLRALIDTTALINSSLDLDTVLNQAMDTVIQLTGAERGYLMLRNTENGNLEIRVARNLNQAQIEESAFTVSRSVVNQVAQSGQPIVTTNAQNDPRFAQQESIVSFAIRSILCVPLLNKDEVIGVIYADNRILSGLFGESELAMLSAFANQAVVAVENARFFEQLQLALVEITEIQDLMDNVFTSIPSGVIVTDANNQVRTYNPAARDILQLESEASIGQAVDKLLPYFAEGLINTLEAVRTEKRQSTVELSAQVGQLGVRNLNFRMSPLASSEQNAEGVALVLDDLTETRQREAQLNVVRRYLPPAMVDNIQHIAQLELGGVRREITVMYIDVRPIDSFAPDLTPKQQMAALNRYTAVCSKPIHEHGGVIDKYMGTEVMALFNTQLNPSETHQIDAVNAAFDAVDAFLRFYVTEGEPAGAVYYRIGIHSGVATMGNVGSVRRREFTALGDTVNLAHRLVDMADRGEILISEDTHRKCYPAYRGRSCQPLDRGVINIRGRQQPAQIFQLVRKAD